MGTARAKAGSAEDELGRGLDGYVGASIIDMEKVCSVDGCEGRVAGRGWCAKHYWRMRVHGDLYHERHLESPDARFWASHYVNRHSGTRECWIWAKARDRNGYGVIQVDGRQIRAHRFSYALHNGPIPEGLVVMHLCDVPACVNPAHLRLGTNAENSADAARKGRRLPGSQNHQAKLTERQVIKIRDRYAAGGITQAELANDYGVSGALINHILTRKGWKHI